MEGRRSKQEGMREIRENCRREGKGRGEKARGSEGKEKKVWTQVIMVWKVNPLVMWTNKGIHFWSPRDLDVD